MQTAPASKIEIFEFSNKFFHRNKLSKASDLPFQMFEMPEELTLDKIDWDWVQKCNKPAQLKKALFLLEQDGDSIELSII